MSLDDVSNVTKIGSRMLQAIEEEHFEQLPGGVFNKGFIRAYAKQVGLNDEEAVNEYLACLRQAQIDAQAVWEPQTRDADGKPSRVSAQVAANKAVADRPASRSLGQAILAEHNAAEPGELPELQLPRLEDVRPPRRFARKGEREIPWRPAVIAVLLLIAVGVVWQHHVRHAHAETAAGALLPVAALPAVEVAPSPAPTNAASDLSSNPKSPSAKPAAAKPQVANTPAPSPSPSTSIAKKPESAAANDAGDDVTPAPAAAKAAPPDETPALLMLVIRANENSWISVTADGQPVSQETLIAPANTSVHAKNQIVARVGNAAGVSFLWNGQEIQPEGAESEVKTFVFDSAGMHEVGSTPAAGPSRQ